MGYGEAVTRNFTILYDSRVSEDFDTGIEQLPQRCCFELKVFADANSDDALKNDSSQFIDWLEYEVTSGSMRVDKYNSITGDWDEIFSPDTDNDAHGTWFPKYANFNSPLPIKPTYNNRFERMQGYHIDWKKILTTYGQGNYRIVSISTKNASTPVERYSPDFCLMQYTPERANGTVRFEGSLTGYRQDLNNNAQTVDFTPIKWTFQIRLPNAFFGINTETLTKEYTEYNDGSRVWITDDSTDKYICITGEYPEWLHKQLKYWYFKADDLKVTDYNRGNANTIIKLPVTRSGSYDPTYALGKLNTKAEIEFERAMTTPNAKRC